jgi:predicted ATPase/DNA-binding SARP family transcriptional activator
VGDSLRVGVLGPLEILDDDRVVAVSGAKQRAIVALLALNAGRVVSADRLIAEVWADDAPADAANALQHHVSRLRRALGSERVVASAPGYVLTLDGSRVDAIAFERLASDGRAALREDDPDDAASKLREALALWRGEPLAEFADQQWAVPEAARLERLHEDVLEDRLDCDLALGRHADVVAELEALTAEHPFRERMWALLMLALYRSGRQAGALDAYRRAREALADAYGLDPGPELQRLEGRILAQDPSLDPLASAPARPRGRPVAVVRGNLPAPLTTFVGRQEELVELGRLLGTCRLLSLTGPGGAGKTRLAIELGRRIAEEHRDGVWLVELGPVTDPEGVAAAVASALESRLGAGGGGRPPGSTTVDRIHDRLRDGDAVLVFDNCEHLLDATAGLVRTVLEDHQEVKVLVTSREPLGVGGETRWPVPPLRVPPRSFGDVRDLLASEAVRLFVDRATEANPSFELTSDNAADVAELCRRLDGLPLALELAAARVSALPVSAIAEALNDRFHLLTAGGRAAPLRQQTLRAAVDWSYALLAEPEQRLFRACSVFPAGFSIEAAADVGERHGIRRGEALGTLGALVDKSMLVAGVGPNGEPRYSMLETLRSYGLEVLAESGETDAAERALVEYAVGLAETGDAGLRGRDHLRWLRLLDAEFENVRAGFDRAVRAGDAGSATRIAAALGWYFSISDRHRHGEGRAWIDQALSLRDDGMPDGIRAYALAVLSYLAGQELDLVTAVAAGYEAISLAGEDGGSRALALAYLTYAMALGATGTAERVPELVRTGREIARGLGDEWLVGTAELVLAPIDMRAGDVEAVVRRGTAAVESGRRSGYDPWEIWGRLLLAWADERTGSIAAARAEYEHALERSRALGFDHYVSFVLARLARLATVDGDGERALDLASAAVAGATSVGSVWFAGVAREALAVALERAGDEDAAEREHRAVAEALAGAARPAGRESFFTALAGDPAAQAMAALARRAEARGAAEEAGAAARTALERAEREQDAETVAAALETLARLSSA